MSRANRTGVYELPETPELADLFKAWGRRLRLSLRTNTVATVLAYNATTQKAKVTVDILQILKVLNPLTPGADPNQSNQEVEAQPGILNDIPVAWPRTTVGYLTFPLIPQDTGELIIQDRGLQQWLKRQEVLPVDPVQAATHALQDAVFHPGLHDNIDAIVPPTVQTATVLHGDTFIRLGRAAALGVARLTDQTSANATMAAWITMVTAAVTTMAAPFNVAPPGTPVVSLGPGSVVPPIAPTDFGVITTASTKTSSE